MQPPLDKGDYQSKVIDVAVTADKVGIENPEGGTQIMYAAGFDTGPYPLKFIAATSKLYYNPVVSPVTVYLNTFG